VTVTDTLTTGLTSTQSVVVVSNAAVSLQVTGIPNNVIAGALSTITVTARDSLNNVSTEYRGTVRFTSTNSGDTLPATYTFTAADAGTHTFANAVAAVSSACGSWTVTATDAAQQTLTGSQTVNVIGQAYSLGITVTPNPLTAGATATVTVTALDFCGQAAAGYRGTIGFSSTDESSTLPADYTFTAADNGSHTFTGVILRMTGNQTVAAYDLVNTSLYASQQVQVLPGPAASLSAATTPTTPVRGRPFTFTVTALDAFGNVVTGYNRAVTVTSNDPAAVIAAPNPYTYAAADNGTHGFTVTLNTVGIALTVTATDSGGLTVTLTF
jgi:hypothetical protein